MNAQPAVPAVSRRQVIKAGTIAGVWAVPAVMFIGAGPASADPASPGGGGNPTTPPTDGGVLPTSHTSTSTSTSTTSESGVAAAPVRRGGAVAGDAQGSLPRTGFDSAALGVAGAALVAGGAAAVRMSRSGKPDGKHVG